MKILVLFDGNARTVVGYFLFYDENLIGKPWTTMDRKIFIRVKHCPKTRPIRKKTRYDRLNDFTYNDDGTVTIIVPDYVRTFDYSFVSCGTSKDEVIDMELQKKYGSSL